MMMVKKLQLFTLSWVWVIILSARNLWSGTYKQGVIEPLLQVYFIQ